MKFANRILPLPKLAGVLAFQQSYRKFNAEGNEPADIISAHWKKQVKLQSISQRYHSFASIPKDNPQQSHKMQYSDFIRSIVLPRMIMRTDAGHAVRNSTLSGTKFVGDDQGQISLSEYEFILKLLKLPTEHVAVGFYMFDLDQNGLVDQEEFLHVVNGMLQLQYYSSEEEKPQGSQIETVSKRMLKHFFGSSGKRKITPAQFQEVLNVIRNDILTYEFLSYASGHAQPQDAEKPRFWRPWSPTQSKEVCCSKISNSDFSATLISNMGSDKRISQLIKNVFAIQAEAKNNEAVISLSDFLLFHSVMESSLNDILMALSLRASGSRNRVSSKDFVAASIAACGKEVPVELLKIFFRTFDQKKNGDDDNTIAIECLQAATQAFEVTFKEHKETSAVQRFLNCIKPQE